MLDSSSPLFLFHKPLNNPLVSHQSPASTTTGAGSGGRIGRRGQNLKLLLSRLQSSNAMSAPGLRPLDQSLIQQDNDSVMTLRTQIPLNQDKIGTYHHFPPSSNQPRVFGAALSNQVHRGTPNLRESVHSQNSQLMKSIWKLSYKTKLCAKFRSGTCPYGANCTYAHGVEDLREFPSDWKKIISMHEEEHSNMNTIDLQRANNLRICRRSFNGDACPYGNRCSFLHLGYERARESSTIDVGKTFMESEFQVNRPNQLEQTGSRTQSGEAHHNPSFQKTKICNKWEMSGQCAFGDKCHFAHGIAELRKYCGNDDKEGNIIEGRDTRSIKSHVLPNKRQASSNQLVQLPSKRCLLDWKVSRKLNHIYGDWIEEMGHKVGS